MNRWTPELLTVDMSSMTLVRHRYASFRDFLVFFLYFFSISRTKQKQKIDEPPGKRKVRKTAATKNPQKEQREKIKSERH
uniref:Uncharacterized protein n=1 Tax=Leishmania guyanensis TaxID=5670 RepID=A0A1E1IQV6_LEIGU|nr:Hypothetical protein BN36_1111510 [Leishmania guyanensis]